MFVFEIILLLLGLLVSLINLYKSNSKKEQSDLHKTYGFKIQNISKVVAISYVLVFITSLIVFIVNENESEKNKQIQMFLSEKVTEISSKFEITDNLIYHSLDTLNSVIERTNSNTNLLSKIDSSTIIAIHERSEALSLFQKSTKELNQLSKTNLDLNLRNTNLTQFLLEMEKGGNSYPVIKPVSLFSDFYDKNQITLEIVNIGQFNQKNVRIDIFDLTSRQICYQSKGQRLQNNINHDGIESCKKQYSYQYKIGDLNFSALSKLDSNIEEDNSNLKHADGITFHTVTLNNKQRNVMLEIWIRSNNGLYKQYLGITKNKEAINGGLFISLRRIGDKLIYENRNHLYPKVEYINGPPYLDPYEKY